MSKPPLTVLVGAGGSLELKAPSTGELTGQVADALKTMHDPRQEPAWAAPLTDVFIKTCERFYGDGLNFEHVIHAIETMNDLQRAWRHPQSSNRIAEAMFVDGPRADLMPLFEDERFLIFALGSAFERIHRLMADASQAATANEHWPKFAHWWSELGRRFELSIVTLNYDTFLEQALSISPEEQGFFHVDGEPALRFDETRFESQTRRLMHMHGSVHFGYRESDDDINRFAMEEKWDDLYWYPDPKAARRSAYHARERWSQAGRSTFVGPLISGLQKPDKLLVEPYAAYHRAFGRAIRQSHRLLVVGYGFGDHHVNSLLERFPRWHGAGRKVAVVAWQHRPVWQPGNIWGPEFPREHEMLGRWAGKDLPMQHRDYICPWFSDSKALCVCGGGLIDAAANHLATIVDFLS